MAKFQDPPEEKSMDCIMCGSVNTVIYVESAYNGHKRGECEKCGMRFME